MAEKHTKNFNAMLQNSKDMPKIQITTDQKSIETYGGNRMYFAPPIDYDRGMKQPFLCLPEYATICFGTKRSNAGR